MAVIHEAAASNILELVQKCLDNGVNVNARDATHGRTALHFAAEKGHASLVKFLLARGAKPDELDFYGLTALEVAEEAEQQPVIAVLRREPEPQPLSATAPVAQGDRIYAFACPACGKVLRVPARYFGIAGKCSRCGAPSKVTPPKPFDEAATKSLDRALDIFFSEALPVLSFENERAIREDYEHIAKAWKSQELVQVTEKGLRGILEKNLRVLEWRSDFQGFQIIADLEGTPAVLIMAECNEAQRPVAVRIWRGSEYYYICGGLDFIPHP
ncbi:MAG: ankyrin repeat domain-containing protein [FCB group bacterium]|jgi:predicted RNA-binding Zn-ribbon protein involved in translation (DUF1610 family)|nr:ankyrin repeat domain-containing protein [FCB group bacterium]